MSRLRAVAMLLFLLVQCGTAMAQANDWEQYLSEFYENDEEAAVSMEEAYEHLTELARQPLDVNTVEEADLLLIPGIDGRQIDDILLYRHRYGRMRSIDELAMIESIDPQLRRYLSCFLTVGDAEAAPWYKGERLREGLRHARHDITATAQIPTYYRAGDRNAPTRTGLGENRYAGKYLGDPVRHSVRYTFAMGSNAVINLAGGKTAGEPFGAPHNRWGYGRYVYNLSIREAGAFRHVVAGLFRAQFGMGLILNNNFSMGKQGMLAAMGRRLTAFTPHSSQSDSRHFQGIAATVALSRRLQMAAFWSYRNIDATLNGDGTISTILSQAYHRTATEMEKRNNAAQLATGIHLGYERNIWGVGVSAVYSWLNRPVNPTYATADTIRQSQMYRRYYPRGNSFANVSADYRYRWRELAFSGETAIDRNANVATLNSLTWQSPWGVTFMALQRYYSYMYGSLLGSSFSDNGMVSNESGLYIGAQWNAGHGITVEGYTDVAYFPWYRYRVSDASYAWDNCIKGTAGWGNWKFSLRYRIKMKQRDKNVDDRKMLLTKYDNRLRLAAAYDDGTWNVNTQVEGCTLAYDETSKGLLMSLSAGWKATGRLQCYAHAAYFNTDDYDSRIYAYERGMQYSFGYSPYYGKGMRAALMVKWQPGGWIAVQGKVGHTRFFDRQTIGTAERMIFSSHCTDIDLQLKLRL